MSLSLKNLPKYFFLPPSWFLIISNSGRLGVRKTRKWFSILISETPLFYSFYASPACPSHKDNIKILRSRWSMEHWLNDIDRETRNTRREICPSATFVHYRFHMHCPGIECGLCWWRTAASCLSLGKVFLVSSTYTSRKNCGSYLTENTIRVHYKNESVEP